MSLPLAVREGPRAAAAGARAGAGAEGAPSDGVKPRADGIKEGTEKEAPPMAETGARAGAAPVADAAGAARRDCAAAYGAKPGQARMMEAETKEAAQRRRRERFMR